MELLTADDVWLMGEDARVELIRGVLRERPAAGGRHGRVGGRFTGFLGRYGEEHDAGRVLSSGTGFVLANSPTTLLVPDVAFVGTRDLPTATDPDWFLETPPRVTIEIHSPSRRFGELVERMGLYLTFGVPLVWLASIFDESVVSFSSGGIIRIYRSGDVLDGGDVLPGFSVPVDEFFP
jgi:Uma2 family endonuclease